MLYFQLRYTIFLYFGSSLGYLFYVYMEQLHIKVILGALWENAY